jgi:hypothetical protein
MHQEEEAEDLKHLLAQEDHQLEHVLREDLEVLEVLEQLFAE